VPWRLLDQGDVVPVGLESPTYGRIPMLTAEGCRQRRQRLLDALAPIGHDHLFLADPIHLVYLANFWVDPISLAAGFPGYLLLRRDGHTKLLYDDRQKAFGELAHVDARRPIDWYDGESPAHGPRQLAPLGDVNPTRHGMPVHDRPGDVSGATLIRTLAELRRKKDADEIAVLRRCMAATEAGHAWARANIRPGMTELEVYSGAHAACVRATGRPCIVYGDFAVSPGPERRGGPPTDRVLAKGDLFILDFSVVLFGYRSDFTDTLVVGAEPTAEQRRLFDLCKSAMSAGERELRPGTPCRTAYEAMVAVFAAAGMSEHFPVGHHGGHGIGLSHPEAPYIVRDGTETFAEGDVVTLEPGLYVPNVGGVRIENNYLIGTTGPERLSNHRIGPADPAVD
jgi:Xaa-Pro aminopeptidase